MSVWWQVAIASFVAALLLVPAARQIALRRNLTDVPNERSSHTVPKPRIGGIGIIVAATVGLVAAWTMGAYSPQNSLGWLLAILLGLAAVGFCDDVWSLSAGLRMPLYLLGAVAIALLGFRIEELNILGVLVPLGGVGGLIFSALFVAWYANLFNFMDGIDGIAGGAATITTTSLALVFAQHGETTLGLTALSLSGATLGFLLFNYPPSSVFMGDVGSVFLGSACGGLSIAAISMGLVSPVAAVLLMFPFVFDASFTLARRALKREKVWQAHRTHIYQQLCDLGLSHRQVTNLYTGLAIACAWLGWGFDGLSVWAQASALVLMLVGSLVGGIWVLRVVRQSKGVSLQP